MAEKLTPQQEQAVQLQGTNLLVSAAAGSGKTKVLVDRLLRWLNDSENPANLDDFLIITYTKAAASELRGKIAAKLTEAIAANPENRHLQRQMQRLFLAKISTVHGFCADLLREYAYKLDLSADFRVADEPECEELRLTVLSKLLEQTYSSIEENKDFRTFVDTQGIGRDDRLISEIILKVYDSARCHLDMDAWLNGCVEAAQVEGVTDAAQTVWGADLMQRAFSRLDAQIETMKRCLRLSEKTDGFEKVSVNLGQTVEQLEFLRSSETWDEILTRKTIDYGRLTFPKKGDQEAADQIKACRNACKDDIARAFRVFAGNSAQVLRDLQQTAAGTRGLVALVRQFAKDYDAAKRSRHVLDFGDLEHKTLDLLLGSRRGGPTAAAREIGERFREVLVDEYQDSNGVQDAIFSALTGKRNNCFMVGDVKQSIYQFRLADPGIFLQKYKTYGAAEDDSAPQGRKVLLSANFRSGGEVISAVNDVFSDCMSPEVGGLFYGQEEALREGVPHTPLPDPAVELYSVEIREDTYGEEAAFVAQRIARMLAEGQLIRDGQELRPVRPEDIVILLRSPGSVGACYQQALESRGIRCRSGGGTDLLQTQEIGALRALLQTVANPRQDIPLIAALANPVFGFTADDLASIRAGQKKGSVYDALCRDHSRKAVNFRQMLEHLREVARMETVTKLMEEIFLCTRMDSLFAAMEGGEARLANLQAFYSLTADLENAGRRELAHFLDYLDALEEKGLASADDSSTAGAVSIMSIHKSKGLEFPVVFLCGLSRKFNKESLRDQVLCDRELGLGLSCADTVSRIRYPAISKYSIMEKTEAESLSEELRVLYVAMTRAKDRLIMTCSNKNLQAVIEDCALRHHLSSRELMTRDVSCPGEWILYSAISRIEAGQLHNLGGRPGELRVSQYPWRIEVVQAPDTVSGTAQEVEIRQELPNGAEEQLKKNLQFRYGHLAATKAPSKQTATQQKGRQKDREAEENAQPPRRISRSWRNPAFVNGQIQGKQYGSVIHSFLQHVNYSACGDPSGVEAEVRRMVERKLLPSEQASLIDCHKIAAFFKTPVGKKLRSGTPCLREFKFSILDDGSRYGDGLDDEQVLLQGVVDCALLEEDGLTVVDFKTDSVSNSGVEDLVNRYRPQVETYAHALERIYRKPVKKKYLFLFHFGILVEV